MKDRQHSTPSDDVLPDDGNALLVGRVDVRGIGPCLVAVADERLHDITGLGPTMSDLLDLDDPAAAVRAALESTEDSWDLAEVLTGDGDVWLLSPFDLSALKAAGVTFAKSMVERVIEEHAKGDQSKAAVLRERLGGLIGDAVQVVPGSSQAAEVKTWLQNEGLWSQYLEVGIGPDPEIFTKSQPLSSVGYGAEIGVLARSTWNNPEPEVVLAVSGAGVPVGATLGNDVNLRDFEGRSALLLAEAKDNNASCALGPFIRLFDSDFGLDELRQATVELTITGSDGFVLEGRSLVSEMSRTFDELVSHAWGDHHQYPDGFALFTGTMFAPTEDRDAEGQGFTHHLGDIVRIRCRELGTLSNTVTHSEKAPRWTFGIRAFMANLAGRGLL